MSDHSEYRDPWEIVPPLTDEERAAKMGRMRERLANAENDERDAARYRWLRDRGGMPLQVTLAMRREPEEWDAEIDAAMRAGDPS